MTKEINFFISYQQADRTWAEWIAWILEESGYTTAIQSWDFRPGSNFVLKMQEYSTEAQRTIIVLSPDYLERVFTQSEWAAAFAKDPTGNNQILVPIRVRKCQLTGILAQIIYIDLFGISDEKVAKQNLLSGIEKNRVKPLRKPKFPATEYIPYFPNSANISLSDKYTELVTNEFNAVMERVNSPKDNSKSCNLFFGQNFPFGQDKIQPIISRCAIAYDIEELLAATVGDYQAPNIATPKTFIPNIVYKAASIRWRILVSLIAGGLNKFSQDILLIPLIQGIQSEKIEQNIPYNLKQLTQKYIRDIDSNSDFSLSSRILYLVGITCRDNGVNLSDLLSEEQQKYRYRTLRPSDTKVVPTQTSTIVIYFKDHEGSYEIILKALSKRNFNIVKSSSWTLIPGRIAFTRLEVSFPMDIELKNEISYIFSKKSIHKEIYKFSIENNEKTTVNL